MFAIYEIEYSVEELEEEVAEELSNKASALIIATSEFEAYKNSAEKDQKEFHWNNFCEFVKLNMEEWLVINDTI